MSIKIVKSDEQAQCIPGNKLEFGKIYIITSLKDNFTSFAVGDYVMKFDGGFNFTGDERKLYGYEEMLCYFTKTGLKYFTIINDDSILYKLAPSNVKIEICND